MLYTSCTNVLSLPGSRLHIYMLCPIQHGSATLTHAYDDAWSNAESISGVAEYEVPRAGSADRHSPGAYQEREQESSRGSAGPGVKVQPVPLVPVMLHPMYLHTMPRAH